MVELFDEYDVCVAGAGVSGLIAALSAARAGASVLLLESGPAIGGMLTLGRMTSATGHVHGGIYREILQRIEDAGGGDLRTRSLHGTRQTGVWDPAAMRRTVLEMVRSAGIEVLLHATVTDVLKQGSVVKGVFLHVKTGHRLVLARTVIDATGDADVAALAGAALQSGRESDGLNQPMSSYVRVLNVDLPQVARYARQHPEEFVLVDLPEPLPETNEGFCFNMRVVGFGGLIQRAKQEGFGWDLPRDKMMVKAGAIPGEVNLNVTRVNGDPLDERNRTRAELEVERQAYVAFDFLKRYVPGFANAMLLEVASRLGVRESRRIVGEHVVSADEVRSEARFTDAIGLSECPIDVHDPRSAAISVESVGTGYGIPFRALMPKGLDGLLAAGRCASADHVAMGSMRNTPACALMGEAAGVAGAIAATQGTTVRHVNTKIVQGVLAERGIPLGDTPATQTMKETV